MNIVRIEASYKIYVFLFVLGLSGLCRAEESLDFEEANFKAETVSSVDRSYRRDPQLGGAIPSTKTLSVDSEPDRLERRPLSRSFQGEKGRIRIVEVSSEQESGGSLPNVADKSVTKKRFGVQPITRQQTRAPASILEHKQKRSKHKKIKKIKKHQV